MTDTLESLTQRIANLERKVAELSAISPQGQPRGDDLTPAEQLQLLAESGRRSGWDDPIMDEYDDYDASRQKRCP